MTYPYGMKGAPVVGNGLGGLPRRASVAVAPASTAVASAPCMQGDITTLYGTTYAATAVDAAAISSTQFLQVVGANPGAPIATVITVNTTANSVDYKYLTVGTHQTLNSAYPVSVLGRVVRLGSSYLYVAKNTTGYLRCTILTVSGTTVTEGNAATTATIWSFVKLLRVSDTVAVCICSGAGGQINAFAIDISSGTPSLGSIVDLNLTDQFTAGGSTGACCCDNGSIVVASSNGLTKRVVVLTVDGTTIIPGTTTALSGVGATNSWMPVSPSNNGRALIGVQDSGTGNEYWVIVSTSGTSFTYTVTGPTTGSPSSGIIGPTVIGASEAYGGNGWSVFGALNQYNVKLAYMKPSADGLSMNFLKSIWKPLNVDTTSYRYESGAGIGVSVFGGAIFCIGWAGDGLGGYIPVPLYGSTASLT